MTDLQKLLKQAGLRVTSPRLAVLSALQSLPHQTAETIATAARERLGSLSTQAVYDNLHLLVGAGITGFSLSLTLVVFSLSGTLFISSGADPEYFRRCSAARSETFAPNRDVRICCSKPVNQCDNAAGAHA